MHDRHPLALAGFLVGLLVIISAITIAYAALKLYDQPVRKWLQRKIYERDAVMKSV